VEILATGEPSILGLIPVGVLLLLWGVLQFRSRNACSHCENFDHHEVVEMGKSAGLTALTNLVSMALGAGLQGPERVTKEVCSRCHRLWQPVLRGPPPQIRGKGHRLIVIGLLLIVIPVYIDHQAEEAVRRAHEAKKTKAAAERQRLTVETAQRKAKTKRMRSAVLEEIRSGYIQRLNRYHRVGTETELPSILRAKFRMFSSTDSIRGGTETMVTLAPNRIQNLVLSSDITEVEYRRVPGALLFKGQLAGYSSCYGGLEYDHRGREVTIGAHCLTLESNLTTIDVMYFSRIRSSKLHRQLKAALGSKLKPSKERQRFAGIWTVSDGKCSTRSRKSKDHLFIGETMASLRLGKKGMSVLQAEYAPIFASSPLKSRWGLGVTIRGVSRGYHCDGKLTKKKKSRKLELTCARTMPKKTSFGQDGSFRFDKAETHREVIRFNLCHRLKRRP